MRETVSELLKLRGKIREIKLLFARAPSAQQPTRLAAGFLNLILIRKK